MYTIFLDHPVGKQQLSTQEYCLCVKSYLTPYTSNYLINFFFFSCNGDCFFLFYIIIFIYNLHKQYVHTYVCSLFPIYFLHIVLLFTLQCFSITHIFPLFCCTFIPHINDNISTAYIFFFCSVVKYRKYLQINNLPNR